MKKCWFSICKTVVSLGMLPLWFVKLFVGIGHLPSQSNPGEIAEVRFYHSMAENICDLDLGAWMYLSFVLIGISAVFGVVGLLRPENRKIGVAGNVVFGAALLVFIAMLLLASTVARGY